MAIAYVQIHSAETAGGTDTVTISNFDVGSGANRSLVAVVAWADNGCGSPPPSCSSVVFNTTENFTRRVYKTRNISDDDYVAAEIWTLDNPSNATADIVATIAEATPAATGLGISVIEYTGANNGIGQTNTAEDSDTSHAITLNSDANTSEEIFAISFYGADTTITESLTTERVNELTKLHKYYVGTYTASGGDDTETWTIGANRNAVMVALELKVASGAPPSGNPWYSYAQQ